MYTNSFASPFSSRSSFLFFLHSSIDWSFSRCLCFCSGSPSSLGWSQRPAAGMGKKKKSQTRSIFTCDLMAELILTISEIWNIRFINSPWAEQPARELEKLSHYWCAKIAVVTVCVCLVSQGHAVKSPVGTRWPCDSAGVTWKVLTRSQFLMSLLQKKKKTDTAKPKLVFQTRL